MFRKHFFLTMILVALVGSVLTMGLICFLLGINSKSALDLGRFFVALRFIEKHYVQEVERGKLIDGAIGGMVGSLGDPHSLYLAPQISLSGLPGRRVEE